MLDSQWVAQQIGRPLIKAFNKRWVGEGGGDRAAGLGAPAFAGSAPGNVGEIGFGVSQTSVSSDSTGVDSAQFFGVRGGYQIKQEFEIEGQIASSSASGSVAGTGVDTTMRLFMVNGLYNFRPCNKKFVPYAMAGIGRADISVDSGGISASDNSTAYQVGAGTRIFFGKSCCALPLRATGADRPRSSSETRRLEARRTGPQPRT